MVKSYDRYEQEKCFGVISSQSNVIWLPPTSSNSKSVGRAVVGGLEEILMWDIKTGEVQSRLVDGTTPGTSNAPTSTAPPSVTYLTYNEQANIIAAGYTDGSIKVWDIASGSPLISFQGHKSSITTMIFDRSGTRLVSGSSDASIIVWDLVSEEGLFKLKGHRGQINGLSLLSESQNSASIDDIEDYLLTVAKDGLIKLWDLKSRQCIETHLAFSDECWSLGVNRSSDLIVTAGAKNEVKLWSLNLEAEDGHKLIEKGSFEKQSKSRCVKIDFEIISSAKSPSIEVFYLQNSDKTIEFFRFRTEDEIKKAINRRTKRLKTKGLEEAEIIKYLHETEIEMLLTSFAVIRTTSKIKSACWAKNGQPSKKLDILLSLTNNSIEYHTIPMPDNLIKANDNEIAAAKKHSIDLLGHRTDIRAMDIAPDDRLLATASNGELKIWNTKTFNVIRTFQLDGGYALCCKFLPGGTLIAVGYKNGDLDLYDLATSTIVDRIQKAHENSTSTDESGSAIWSMDLTPDGKTLITGGNDRAVKFWNFKIEREEIPGTGNYVSKLKFVHNQTLEVNEDVLCVKVSPDSRLLAISLLNNNVQVVFLDTLKLFLTLYGHKLPVLSIDISDDSKLIITSSADKNIKIWGLDFGDCHRSIFGHQDSIMNVKFIAGSHNFFSSGKDGLIKYWDGDKFECIQKLPAHKSEVWCLAVSSDGKFMISTSHDHSIRMWVATTDQVFLEEEREKEMEEVYENTLLGSLEQDEEGQRDMDESKENEDEAARVSKQTMESLKAGEKLMEALEIGTEDLDATEEYEQHLRHFEAKKTNVPPQKPTPNAILLALGVTGQEYVLNTLSGIKVSQLEDALLVLPFSYSLRLLRFIEIWTNSANFSGNTARTALICRILFFIVKFNFNELVNQRDSRIKNQIAAVKAQLRDGLSKSTDNLGFSIQGLKYAKKHWNLNHAVEYVDETSLSAKEDPQALKRRYTAI
ncbi:Piso0_002783 [Millerozyma farinosa CBS 7064]|uniref:Piso0_002783 protein n=1 Tax=Pichia sorbitophila (strain ATCC MYA-4447 / BCRC 22081 / CBS 7064 / NBRC 10061 / NRRL Y-12695) TaxID=559304 RepID=G8YFY8_PICSO|nr:Piso0_002783 [Millerozyma farinosa CBS 7064]